MTATNMCSNFGSFRYSPLPQLGFRMYLYYSILIVHLNFFQFHRSNSSSVFFCGIGCPHVGQSINQSTCNYSRKPPTRVLGVASITRW